MKLASITVALLGLTIACRAQAQRVSVQVRGCSETALPDELRLTRILSVELRGDGITAVRAARGLSLADVRLRVPCGAEAVEVRVTDPRDGLIHLRRVSLTGVPRSLQLRWLAVSTAELLRAGRTRRAARATQVTRPPQDEARPTSRLAVPNLAAEASGRAAPTPGPVRASLSAPEVGAPDASRVHDPIPGRVRASLAAPHPEPPERTPPRPPSDAEPSSDGGALDAVAVVRSFPAHGALLAGAQIGATLTPVDHVAVSARAGALGTETSSRFGGAALVMLPVSLGAAARFALGSVSLDVGARIEGGAAIAEERRASSDNQVEHTYLHGFFLTAATLEAVLPLTLGLALVGIGEVGWVVAGFRARVGEEVTTIGGMSVTGGAGLRLTL